MLWKSSNIVRLLICSLPPNAKRSSTDIIAAFVYFPLARLAALFAALKLKVGAFPLNAYMHCRFYTMRTDSRDRFGTPLEKRFTRSQITSMCAIAGLVDLKFSDSVPFLCVVGFKA